MIGRTNAVSKPGVELSLVVSVTSGAAVTATKGSKTVNGTAAGGSCVLSLPEAGTWSVKAALNGQTSDTKSVSVVDSYAVALTFFSATITVNVDSGASVTLKKGGTTIATKTSNGTAVFTVTETGAYTVTATKNGQTTSGSVNVVSGTTSYSLTLSFVSSTLNNNEWSVIKSVSDAGQGANYWSIGDRKAVTLNGTVGKLSLSNVTTYAFIIGFNHNASVEGANRIHFQLAKTALSGGTDVCFCDNQYGPDSGWSSPGAGYFVMNASNTNSGGWKSSQMRTNICGTSLSSYSGTIIAVIPAALRAVLKSVTKYTDNTANGGGSTASYVTATTDYFFLLSEFEVFGSISYGNTNEKNKQAQYAYYSAGNSKIKYKHNGTSTAARWWLRSPYASYSYSFVRVGADGTVTGAYAHSRRGGKKMSVPKSRRGESPAEYINLAREIYVFTYNRVRILPKSYTFYFSLPLYNAAREAYRMIKTANLIYIDEKSPEEIRRRNIQRRKEYYETAQGYYNSMLDVLDLAYMTVNHEKIPPNVLKEWVKLITDELSQISKIKRSDKARA